MHYVQWSKSQINFLRRNTSLWNWQKYPHMTETSSWKYLIHLEYNIVKRKEVHWWYGCYMDECVVSHSIRHFADLLQINECRCVNFYWVILDKGDYWLFSCSHIINQQWLFISNTSQWLNWPILECDQTWSFFTQDHHEVLQKIQKLWCKFFVKLVVDDMPKIPRWLHYS